MAKKCPRCGARFRDEPSCGKSVHELLPVRAASVVVDSLVSPVVPYGADGKVNFVLLSGGLFEDVIKRISSEVDESKRLRLKEIFRSYFGKDGDWVRVSLDLVSGVAVLLPVSE